MSPPRINPDDFASLSLEERMQRMTLSDIAIAIAAAANKSGRTFDILDIGSPQAWSVERRSAIRAHLTNRLHYAKDQAVKTKEELWRVFLSRRSTQKREPFTKGIDQRYLESEGEKLKYLLSQLSPQYVRATWHNDDRPTADTILAFKEDFRSGNLDELQYLFRRPLMMWTDTYYTAEEPRVLMLSTAAIGSIRIKHAGVYQRDSPEFDKHGSSLLNKGSRQVAEWINSKGGWPAETEWPLVFDEKPIKDVIGMTFMYAGDDRRVPQQIQEDIQQLAQNKEFQSYYAISETYTDQDKNNQFLRTKIVLEPRKHLHVLVGEGTHPHERVEIQFISLRTYMKKLHFGEQAHEQYVLKRNREYKDRAAGVNKKYTGAQVTLNDYFSKEFSFY